MIECLDWNGWQQKGASFGDANGFGHCEQMLHAVCAVRPNV